MSEITFKADAISMQHDTLKIKVGDTILQATGLKLHIDRDYEPTDTKEQEQPDGSISAQFEINGPSPIIEQVINDVPLWVKILPDSWEGETIRAHIKIAVSKMAIEDIKFDLKGYVSAKFTFALKNLIKHHGMSEIHLKPRFGAEVDSHSYDAITFFHFYIEFEKPKE